MKHPRSRVSDRTWEERPAPFLYLPDGTKYNFGAESPGTRRGPQSHLPTREIDFEELPDGRLLEVVEDRADPSRTLLVVREEGDYKLVQSLDFNGQLLVPLPRDHESLRNVVLPTAPVEGPSGEELTALLTKFIAERVNLTFTYPLVVALFTLCTWFVDRLDVAPYLMVVGPPVSGKTTLLNVLALLCRRPLLVGDISSAAIYRSCRRTCPTLLLDESSTQVGQSPSATRHFLRVGTTREGVARSDGTYDAFGAKVIAALEPPSDPALNSRCITVPMLPGNPSQKDLQDSATRDFARTIQGYLLRYRLENWRSVRATRVPGSEVLPPRTQDLLSDIAAVTPDVKELRDFLLAWFRSHGPVVEEDSRSWRLRLVNSILYRYIHMVTGGPGEGQSVISHLMESDLTSVTNRELGLRGEAVRLTPESVGHTLTALGLLQRDRTGRGMRLRLDSLARVRIHQNAKVYGQESFRLAFGEELKDCPFCKSEGFVITPQEERASPPQSGSKQ